MSGEGAAEGGHGLRLAKSASLAQALAETIHAGEVESLIELLRQHPGLASARTVDDKGSSGTPLHWAASSDDEEVARALIDGGADIEATGASIAGGTPLDDAVGYGCWRVARLLVERGARHDDPHQGVASRVAPTPSWGDSRPLDVADSIDTGREALVHWLRDQGATKSGEAAT